MDDVTEAIIEEFNGWLAGLFKSEGSTHVKVGHLIPMYRMPDGLVRLDRAPLTREETDAIADAIVPASRRDRLEQHGETDLRVLGARGRPLPHERVPPARIDQHGAPSPKLGATFAEVGLPDAVRQLSEEHRGLILVTGPTGSGKTTTLSAMIEHINETKAVHIVTVEDPVEVLYQDKLASFDQREVGTDTDDFLAALRAALPQDPDVILIGEMRDTETVRAADPGGRDRSPRSVDASYRRCDRDRQPGDRLLPAPSAEAGAPGARRDAPRHHLSAPRAHNRRGTPSGARDHGEHRSRLRADRRPGSHRRDQGCHRGRRALRDHHLRQYLLNLVREGKVTIESAMKNVSSQHDFMLALQQAGISVTIDALSPAHSA